MGAPYFFWIKDLNTQANFCEEYFYPASIKNYNGAVALRIGLCVTWMEPTTPSRSSKGRNNWIGYLLNFVTLFLFLILIKLKAFCITQNETPKMVKNPPLIISCHIHLWIKYCLYLCNDEDNIWAYTKTILNATAPL